MEKHTISIICQSVRKSKFYSTYKIVVNTENGALEAGIIALAYFTKQYPLLAERVIDVI